MSLIQDYTPVILRKTIQSVPQTQSQIYQAKQKGLITTVKKSTQCNTNSINSNTITNRKNLDSNDVDDFKLPTVSVEFKIALQQARTAQNLTQKDLAQKLNVKQSVIVDYESGKAIPNSGIISLMNRVLGVSLPKIAKQKRSRSADSQD